MLGSVLRLAMLAGSGPGIASGFRHAILKVAGVLAAAVIGALVVAGGIGSFGIALYFVVTPEYGPAWGAVAAGLLLIFLAAILALICRWLYVRRRRPSRSGASGLGGALGAAALGASMGGGPSFDVKGLLERNAGTVLLTAFIAGMVMNNRR